MSQRELNGPPTMSPDGSRIAWLSSGDAAARLVVFNVASRRVESRISGAPSRVRAFTWSHLPGTGITLADATGNEQWALHLLRDGKWSVLASGAQLRIAGLSARRPEEVLVAINERDSENHDYEVVSLRTGERTCVLRNAGYAVCYFDADYRPRLIETVNTDGSRDLWHGEPERARRFLHIPHEHALVTRFCHFSSDGEIAYTVLPNGTRGIRLAALRCIKDEPAVEKQTIFSTESADIVRIIDALATGRPEYVEVERFRRRTVALASSLVPPLAALRRRLGAEPAILERRLDDRLWLVARYRAYADAQYFCYEPMKDELWPLSEARPGRSPSAIFCRPVSVGVRTGQRMVTFLSGPCEGDRPNPAVLLVHGGPWRRSGWAFEPRRAWLAERGFTVLEPNFRGSTGFGVGWVNAADRQWGAAMQDDLEDSLDWAISRGYADPARIALVGGSYGGYAVLQLAATSTREFACVVAMSPLTDLAGFVANLPAPWRSAAPVVRRRVGDPASPVELQELTARSPVHNAAAVRCPVLLIHGANDARIPVKMSSRMFLALARAGKEATLALFPDEGHEIIGAANQRARDMQIAWFLARHLHGGESAEQLGQSSMKIFHTPKAAKGRSVPC